MKESEFRKYYDRLYMPLCMYCLRILGDTDESDDAVQEAFVAAWRLVADADKPDNFRAYMYRAVRNQAIMKLRARERHDALADIEEPAEPDDSDMDTSERDAAVWKAVDALPDRCREIFLLSKRDGLTYAEIADELSLSVKTVEHQVSKALSRLRDTLSQHGGHIFFLPFL